ncbi:MAG: DUF1330 domain-containing protein [Nannocystis sp.]|nr:DUF1330 domain-containing protein [Nannocystis sp.]MBA3550004.1 DUF1330 domain-containing protein [Nannocystis sp.]
MAADRRRHVIWVGLEVRDDTSYAAYRARITPMLEQRGGSFGHDLVVARVLRSEASMAMNRVFMMAFPDRATREAFFADPDYRRARADLFEPAVASTHFLAEYDE